MNWLMAAKTSTWKEGRAEIPKMEIRDGKWTEPRRSSSQPFKELLTDSRPMPHSGLGNHRPPQLRLPVRLFALLPSQDHFRTMDRVLVENVSYPVAKLRQL